MINRLTNFSVVLIFYEEWDEKKKKTRDDEKLHFSILFNVNVDCFDRITHGEEVKRPKYYSFLILCIFFFRTIFVAFLPQFQRFIFSFGNLNKNFIQTRGKRCHSQESSQSWQFCRNKISWRVYMTPRLFIYQWLSHSRCCVQVWIIKINEPETFKIKLKLKTNWKKF